MDGTTRRAYVWRHYDAHAHQTRTSHFDVATGEYLGEAFVDEMPENADHFWV